ncbi:lactate dehydrogenase [Rhodospirillales bacterium TMPK1]|uniref:Lactate dehydrogenase n=1 Tax=Roseiterribacter gracilis TaxID=2812848 RepID=A0A8S8XEY9_9PROT|nr:lactate dehydrogenase [Rhodospirillales bacterium TMPK1]
MPRPDAQRVAACLVDADLRGVASHGVGRIPIYTERLRRKLVNPTPSLTTERALTVAARIDGDNGLGFVVGTRAMDLALEIADVHGVGLVLAHRSTHYGMAASYLLQALDAGFCAFAFTNASPAMPIWGGRDAFLGTSPFAFAAPGEPPVVIDMAMSVVARGKIRRAMQRGEPIPEGWALDAEGRPTTDAKAGYDGVVLPAAGVKGSALSLMMEILAGVLSGAAFGGEVRNQYVDFEQPQNVGHCFLALKPDLFISRAELSARMTDLANRAKGGRRAQGVEEILLPGEPESRMAVKRRAEGIPLDAEELATVVAEADAVQVDVPPVMRTKVA